MKFSDMMLLMARGSVMTIEIFAVTLALALPFGIALTYMNISKNATLRRATESYVLLLRGTPLLLQLFFIYYGVPYIPIIGKYLIASRFTACIIAFVLNYAAYFAEIFRGGLLAVDIGQYDAAKALGISSIRTQVDIVIPQMIRVVLPTIGNEAIILVKDTALVTVLAQPELLHITKNIVNSTSNVVPYAYAACFYLAMSYVVTIVFKELERRASY